MAVYKRQPKETKRNYVWRVLHEEFGDTECSREELFPFISKRSDVSFKNLSEQLSSMAGEGYATKRKCPSRKRMVYSRIISGAKQWNQSHVNAQAYSQDHNKVNDVIEGSSLNTVWVRLKKYLLGKYYSSWVYNEMT